MAVVPSSERRPPQLVGYARVSTKDQDLGSQEDALRAAGVDVVFTDQGRSSRTACRPGWLTCRAHLQKDDTLVVWRLDRIAGSTGMAIEIVQALEAQGVQLLSLTEPEIDTTTPMGRALFGIVAVFAQLRVDTIRENTMAGLASARAQGRVGGRPTVMTPERTRQAVKMREDGMSLDRIASVLGVGRASVSRALRSVMPL